MKSSTFMKKIAGTVFAFSLLIGVGIASSVTANAQYGPDQYRRQQDRDYRDQQRRQGRDYGRGRNYDGYGNYGGSTEMRQTALNAGFNEGVKAGRDDRRRGKAFEYRDSSTFQKAMKDYSPRLGDREVYRQYFREAFAHGYADGYQGY